MPKKLYFPYLPVPVKDPKSHKIGIKHIPAAPILISYGNLSPKLHALVDSGSDCNLLPAQFGELVGIKIKKGKRRTITGIGNVDITGYSHKIKLYIGNVSFETMADFSYENSYPLLGRIGFFNHFVSVNFKENERVLELVYKD